VDRIKGVVDIQHDLPRHAGKGLAIETDHFPPHPDQIAHLGQVLHP